MTRNAGGVPGVDDGVIGEELGRAEVDSIDALYRAEYAGLLRLAYSLTSDEQLAEDVVQESFLRLHQSPTRVFNPVAYLRTCVVNRCRSHHRHVAVVRRTPVDRAESTVGAYDELFDAVRRLPWRQQAVLAMRFHLDLPDDEIAAVLGCRPATVRSTVFRAMATLRKEVPR